MEERLIAILRLAKKYNANYIHIVNNLTDTTIEIRIDGVLRKVKTKWNDYKLNKFLHYMANLKEKLLKPQTNDFEMFFDGQKTKLRYANITTENCCNGVLRILN